MFYRWIWWHMCTDDGCNDGFGNSWTCSAEKWCEIFETETIHMWR
jgi:hypothetical protein